MVVACRGWRRGRDRREKENNEREVEDEKMEVKEAEMRIFFFSQFFIPFPKFIPVHAPLNPIQLDSNYTLSNSVTSALQHRCSVSI